MAEPQHSLQTPASATAGDWLALHWPALAERLGERRAAFEASALAQAAARGLAEPLLGQRYLNLSCAFGPGFEEKPEHEWALALLLDERLAPPVRLHQLLVRAQAELATRPDTLAALREADQRLMQTAARSAEPGSLLRQPCDIEAWELRVVDAAPLPPYRWADGGWQRTPLGSGEAAPLRVTATEPAPERLHLLAAAEGLGAPLQLQLRQAAHGRCEHGLHPAARWVGRHGLSAWQGDAARSLPWSLHAPAAAAAATGVIGEQPAPDISTLSLPSCGLRDAGLPLGAQQLQLWTLPAHQQLWRLQRRAPLRWQDGPQPGDSLCTVRVERDGQLLAGSALQRAQAAFSQSLAVAWHEGLAALGPAWQSALDQATLQAQALWFDGQAGCAWGLVPGLPALRSEPQPRLAVQAELQFALRLQLAGELSQGGARSRVSLRCDGQQALQLNGEWLGAAAARAALPQLKTSWRWPWQLQFEALAGAAGLLVSALGPATGGLVGEAGLRPRRSGSGWCWYLQLQLEPLAAPLRLHDPVLGDSELHLALLPAQTLIDWSDE